MTERGQSRTQDTLVGLSVRGCQGGSAVRRVRESLALTEGKGGVGDVVRRVIGGLQVGDRRSEIRGRRVGPWKEGSWIL